MKSFLSFALILVALDVLTDGASLQRSDWPYVALALLLSASLFAVRLFAELCGESGK